MIDPNEGVAIWWCSEEDCKQIGCPVYEEDLEAEGLPLSEGSVLMGQLPMPDYVKHEYSSRWGRAGRGRLWVASGLALPGGVKPWRQGVEVYDRAERCGGIVFRMADLAQMLALPGFVTDTKMNILEESDADKT